MTIYLTKQFKREIKDDPSNCVLLVGAGLSKSGVRKEGQGFPDWYTLMKDMIEELRESKHDVKELEILLKKGEYLKIASVFKQKTRHDQFSEFLREVFTKNDIIPSRIHEIILEIGFRGIITTNFDLVFEHQSDRLQQLVYPQFLDEPSLFKRNGFFAKIHGCISTPNPAENIILTEESYDNLRLNKIYQTILQSYFVTHTILTVGFSLRDPDFLALIEDLQEKMGDKMSTIYSLMIAPKQEERDEWRKKGVEIIPYNNHGELLGFFEDMLGLSKQKHPEPKIHQVTKESEVDYDAILEKWERTRKIEDMHQLVQEQINRFDNIIEKEFFLFHFLAIIKSSDEIRLSSNLFILGTNASERILLSLFRKAVEDDSLKDLKPHPIYIGVYNWALKNWPNFTNSSVTECFTWLLDKSWIEYGIDIWETFLSLLNRLGSRKRLFDLSDLYNICQHIEGAQERIEKIVLNPDFIRDDDPEHSWFKNRDLQTLENIRYEKFKKSIFKGAIIDYKNQLHEAFKMEAQLPENVYRNYTETVFNRVFDDYVRQTHLTIHSSSGLYDPEKAHEILEALAEIKGKKQQLKVLWGINRWPENRRGLVSLGEDTKNLREGLFTPLWWRYSTETRIEYLKEQRIHKMHDFLWTTGQEFLLENIMGFTYDIDKEFQNIFNATLDQHLSKDGFYKYEPRPFQEIWNNQELNYRLSNDVPPELVRRIAINRVDWDKFKSGKVRWQEANERGRHFMENQNLNDFFSKGNANYVIDNLLGAYFPEKIEIVLYPFMIEYVAHDLGIDEDALSTIVYLHETVHAYSHIGKDCDGHWWVDFSLPMSDQPNFYPSRPHEAIAQYYTFKMLQMLNDEKLMQTFLVLEQHCIEVYQAWRQTEHYSLEDMRNILVKYRKKAREWPPSV